MGESEKTREEMLKNIEKIRRIFSLDFPGFPAYPERSIKRRRNFWRRFLKNTVGILCGPAGRFPTWEARIGIDEWNSM